MSTDILFVVTTANAAEYLRPMLAAAHRASCSVAVFLTNDGVALASAEALGNTLQELSTAVVCAESWTQYMPEQTCPVTSGSQTDLSLLVGQCKKVISL